MPDNPAAVRLGPMHHPHPTTLRALVTLALAAAGIVLRAAGVAEPRPVAGLALQVDEQVGRLEVRRGGQTLLVYAFAPEQFKPYVKELRTLAGDNVLRDAPADHVHHHGLMYAIHVNGVNFWEENRAPGRQQSVRLLACATGRTADGRPQATFTQVIHWLADAGAAPASVEAAALLVEHRRITLTVDEAAQEVALRWEADFVVGPAAQRVTLTGSPYNGLGLRLPASFDHVAVHENSETRPDSAQQQGDVTPARWSAVWGTIQGREVALALFGRPSNAGQTRFFTMVNPFAYLSVTQSLDRRPLEYAAGDTFRLDYLLAVYAAKPSRDLLEARYRRWLGAGVP